MLKKAIIKATAFLLLLTCCIYFAGLVLMPKRVNVQPDITAKVRGFYNERENSLDVVFCGTSKIFCLINPCQLWNEYGFASYDLATNEPPIWITYYFIKELLKTQKPDLILIDTYFSVYGDADFSETIIHSALDDMSLSENKIEAAWNSDDHDEVLSYVFPFFRYHNRWSQLTREDYGLAGYDEKHPLKGYTAMYAVKAGERPQVSDITEVKPLSAKSEEYLGKIFDLLDENGIDYMFLTTPFMINEEQQMYCNGVKQYAIEHNIKYLDCNDYFDEIGIDFNTDYFDLIHTNVKGAEKVTSFVGKYIKDNFDIPDHRGSAEYADWDETYAYWKQYNEEKMPSFGTAEAEKELEGVLE